MNAEKLELFERAFTAGISGATRICPCGKLYYNPDRTWIWEDGELEGLEADPDANGRDYAIGGVIIYGVEYVNCCDCWHLKAERILAFIDDNAHQIAEYLRLSKQRAMAAAEALPLV